ncbi:C-terminal binding protein [Telmatospirillum siberiense]|uniref:C-terminal binding protein n=1 Tax=Telmatospirillum siberiense TaxID=382514 RepID=A0A2N3PSN8_9PROT|nr:C-terminal binding protein [Telmatospirillum siberiense]PKU23404.1 C-terminal binding protein [Telmatospirillum siberiense]
MRFTILTPDAQYPDDALVERKVAGPDVEFRLHRTRDPAAIPLEDLEACDAFLVWHEMKIDRTLIGKAKKCRVIVRAGVGFNHINLEDAAAAGIPVCNTPDYGTSEVADHTIAFLLSLARGIPEFQDRMRRDIRSPWQYPETTCMRRIRGTTLGLVGLGRIGTATALRAKAFGLHVVVYDPYVSRGTEIAVGVQRVESLEALLGLSDIVSLHCPLTPETTGLMNAAAFAAMKPGALFLNTARGPVVDLDALHQALRSGQVAGAALDVLPTEPPSPDEPLIRDYLAQADWLKGRLLLTPHGAWNSPESRFDARRLSIETVMTYLTEGKLRNLVNGDLLDRSRMRA